MPGRAGQSEAPSGFYVSPSVKGLRIDPQVRSAMEELWPWFWNYVDCQLGDTDRAGDLAERVVYGVSAYLQKYGRVESLIGLCRVAATNASYQQRRGSDELNSVASARRSRVVSAFSAPDWQEEIVWVSGSTRSCRGHDQEISMMLQLRLLGNTWTKW